MRAPTPYKARPMMKQRLRPQRSVNLLPAIISAAITRRNIVIVVCTPLTVVFRSSLMSLIITFMFDPAKLQMNWARASGISTLLRPSAGRPVSSATVRRSCSQDRRPLRVVQPFVEADGGVDQREVGERLGEVADPLAGGVDLLGIEAEVVCIGQHLRERQPGVVQAP